MVGRQFFPMSSNDQARDVVEIVCFVNDGSHGPVAAGVAEIGAFPHDGDERLLKFGHDVRGFAGECVDVASPGGCAHDGSHEVFCQDGLHVGHVMPGRNQFEGGCEDGDASDDPLFPVRFFALLRMTERSEL